MCELDGKSGETEYGMERRKVGNVREKVETGRTLWAEGAHLSSES